MLLLVLACTGCKGPMAYHFKHYHSPFRAIADSNKSYFHSSETGRIIPKNPCASYCEPACFGYEPTCWSPWPAECPGNCPMPESGEIIGGVPYMQSVPPAGDGGFEAATPVITAVPEGEPESLVIPDSNPAAPAAPSKTPADTEPGVPSPSDATRHMPPTQQKIQARTRTLIQPGATTRYRMTEPKAGVVKKTPPSESQIGSRVPRAKQPFAPQTVVTETTQPVAQRPTGRRPTSTPPQTNLTTEKPPSSRKASRNAQRELAQSLPSDARQPKKPAAGWKSVVKQPGAQLNAVSRSVPAMPSQRKPSQQPPAREQRFQKTAERAIQTTAPPRVVDRKPTAKQPTAPIDVPRTKRQNRILAEIAADNAPKGKKPQGTSSQIVIRPTVRTQRNAEPPQVARKNATKATARHDANGVASPEGRPPVVSTLRRADLPHVGVPSSITRATPKTMTRRFPMITTAAKPANVRAHRGEGDTSMITVSNAPRGTNLKFSTKSSPKPNRMSTVADQETSIRFR